VSGDFPVQLATRLPDWSAGGLLRYIVLPVCSCVVSFSKFNEPDTHDSLQTSSRECHEETAFVEFKLHRTGCIAILILSLCLLLPFHPLPLPSRSLPSPIPLTPSTRSVGLFLSRPLSFSANCSAFFSFLSIHLFSPCPLLLFNRRTVVCRPCTAQLVASCIIMRTDRLTESKFPCHSVPTMSLAGKSVSE